MSDPKKLEVDTAHSQHVTDHPFVPEGPWWGLCKRCSLSEAAHRYTTLRPEDRK